VAYRKDRKGGQVVRLAAPGAPVNDFDADETPDRPNIAGGPPPEPPARWLAPADVLVARPDLGPGAATFVAAGDEIRPDLLDYEIRRADNGRRARPKRG
jgi:hypothetical protein